MTGDEHRSQAYWLDVFSKTDLPVLSGIIHELDTVTGKDNGTAMELANVILKDPSLTSRVLKVANCVIYNPSINNPITTITRAVVQLGIAGVKNIYTSVVLIDKLLTTPSQPYLLDGLVHAINSAVQSRNLIEKVSGKASEEVFIAALLYRLGELAFWSFGEETAEKLGELIEEHPEKEDELVKQHLGTSFHALSTGLAEHWELGSVLKEALHKPNSKQPEAKAVLFADKLCKLMTDDPESEAFQKLLAEIAAFCDIEVEEAQALVLESAEEATSELKAFGVHQLHEAAKDRLPRKGRPTPLQPDPQFQLNMLRELGVMVQEKCDINTLFHTVAEGIHLGVGLERVAILLCDAKRQHLSAKHALGKGTENWRSALIIPITEDQPGALQQATRSRETLFIDPQQSNFNTLEERFFGSTAALAAPIMANNRLIGLIYADQAGHQSLDNEQRNAFQYIVQQANHSLETLIRNRNS